ncbi:choice-of-anchor M domain-containing protein [Corynebacterium minutissimum]|uniref:Surface-anchored protein n=2 Tax=Corynebacterium minutissimum TaxID=38301 RepID=A0A2X4R9P1_9CORY|nr:choice-of-anchor M domain-containing protein [Corynebacterium minutissimum]SQI00077.1 surface-anchored protein [Corynebacterium minutissimum]VEG05856.1 surface-anchored protein [Corynebacterium minutissimum]
MNFISHRTAAAPVAATASLSLILMASPVPTALAEGEVFDSGHVDAFYVTAPNGELTLSLKEDVTGSGVVHPGDDVTLKVAEEAWNDATERIDGIGTPTYYLPQTQDSSLLWPGWDTQPAQSAGYKDVDLEFVEVTGPGDIFVFETAGFGDIQPVTEEGALDLVSGDVINQAYPAHRHVNWAFTDPGIYTMTVQAVSNGDASNQVTYTWDVGDGEMAPQDSGTAEHGSADAGVSDNDGDSEEAALGSDSSNPQSPSASGGESRPGTGSSQGMAAGPAPAANATGTHKPKETKDSADRKERTDRKDRKERRAERTAHTSPSAENVDTVAATGYYDSGQSLLPWGIGILGLGMLVLGLAVARLALARGRD